MEWSAWPRVGLKPVPWVGVETGVTQNLSGPVSCALEIGYNTTQVFLQNQI